MLHITFRVVYEIGKVSCYTQEMLSTNKGNKTLLSWVLKRLFQYLVSDVTFSYCERGDLLRRKELDRPHRVSLQHLSC